MLTRWMCFAAFFWIVFCGAARGAKVPRLVVIVVADQMRADYIPRFETDFSTGGLKRLIREGVYFSSAAYDYGATKTGPGHALLASGTYPFQNGIVGNEWYDRASSRIVACGDLAPSLDGRTALKWFVGKSLAQRFHSAYPQGRIFGVSHKARAALLLGGPGQDDAFWWDDHAKQYRAFGREPEWLRHNGPHYPRPGKGGEDVDASIAAVAAGLVSAEHLGSNPSGAPDVLAVSFSELDYVGHDHGSDAAETRMAVVRVDQHIAALLALLEASVPARDMLWVITADHGVTPVPEVTRAKGLPAGRVRLPLSWRAGIGLVQAVAPPSVYVDPAAARRRGLSVEQAAERLAAEALTWEGVQAVYTEGALLKANAPAQLRRSIYPGRSGDLYIVLKPNYIFSESVSGTTHGQPTPDDQNVPLLFWGESSKPHIDKSQVTPCRIAPTLLKALHIRADDLLPPLPLNPHE